MNVIGTAGHVDHGKSSLLRTLTGMEPSRLAEEKKRGMTMQLGYVWFQSEDNKSIGIIDVPGHASYRLAMLSGASVMDAFIFVCACDDGWMPQSEEHLWALSQFGVRHGVIALTKSDLVSEERRRELTEEIDIRFYEAFSRKFPVLPVDTGSAEDIAKVKNAVEQELQQYNLSVPTSNDNPQMYVDRSFNVTGQGVVVTGTLRGGSLHEKQRVEILPGGNRGWIKTIQTYGHPVQSVYANSRVALQVSGIEVKDIAKDSQIAAAGLFHSTAVIDTNFVGFAGFVPNDKKPINVIIIHGGVKSLAKMITVNQEELTDSDPRFVRLVFESGRWVRFGERLLVIASGGDRILGAARVADESPTSGLVASKQLISSLRGYDIEDYVALQVAKSGSFMKNDLQKRTFFSLNQLTDFLADHTDEFVIDDGWIADRLSLSLTGEKVLSQLTHYHREHPQEDGLSETHIVGKLRANDGWLRVVLRSLKAEGKIKQSGPFVRLAGHTPNVDQTSGFVQKLDEIYSSADVRAYSHFEIGLDESLKRRILNRFILDKKIVRISEKHVMSGPVFEAIKDKIAGYLAVHGPSSSADIRDHLAIGRKLVIMIVETLDTQRVTVRSGETRSLLGTGRT